MAEDIRSAIEEAIPGKWIGATEYLLTCPFCGDNPTHDHLFLHIEKRKWNCKYCGESGGLGKLLKRLGVELGDYLIKRRAHLSPTSSSGGEERSFEEFESLAEDYFSRRGREAVTAWNYLSGRGVGLPEVERYKIRYSTSGVYAGRVIFPIFDALGGLVCWCARSVADEKPKYRFPKIGESREKISNCLFGIERAREARAAVLVEGVFDAIAVDRIEGFLGLAIFGKVLSHRQGIDLDAQLRIDCPIYLALDEDAEEDSRRLIWRFAGGFRPVYSVDLPRGSDPSSMSVADLEQALRSARRISLNRTNPNLGRFRRKGAANV